MPRKVTMKMIAETCGISIGTVDRALHNRGDINPETKQLVLETAARLNYKTNILAGALSRKQKLKVAVLYPEPNGAFFQRVEMGLKKAIEELQVYGIEVTSFYFQGQDADAQNALFQENDFTCYDAVAISPVSIDCTQYVNQLTEAGVMVSLFSNDLPDSSRLFFVGSDSRQAGKMAGGMMGLLLSGKGNVAVLGNFSTALSFVERYSGFCQCIQGEYPDISVYSVPDCRLDYEVTKRNLVNLFEQVPDFHGLFCASHSCTVDVIRALQELKASHVKLIGYDVSEVTEKAVLGNQCDFLLYQNPFQQGYQVLHLLGRCLMEGWMPARRQLYLETALVFKQNIENFVDGMMKWDVTLYKTMK